MKVDDSTPPAAPATGADRKPSRPFREVLKEPPKQRPGGVKGFTTRPKLPANRSQPATKQVLAAHERTARTLKEARGEHEAQAETLVARAEEHQGRAQQRREDRLEDRLLDRIVAEAEPKRPPREQPPVAKVLEAAPAIDGGRGPAQAAPAEKTPEVQSLREVVEQIEVFVRSGRPGLSLTVGGSLQAQVTVERTGPGRVSLSFRGKNGPPSHSDVQAVREQLEKRGLLLTSMRLC